MVSESQSRESLLDSLSHVGWVLQEHHFAQLSSPRCGELWVDHADTSARLNIQKQGTEQWPLMLNLVNVLDPSISDYDGDFGRRLAAAYHEIVARSAIHDSIEPVASPTDVAQVLIDTPTDVDFDAIAMSLDTVA